MQAQAPAKQMLRLCLLLMAGLLSRPSLDTKVAHYATFVGTDDAGDRLELKWKAWQFDEPQAQTWELRRLLGCLFAERANRKTNDLVKTGMPIWRPLFLACGLAQHEAVFPSRQAEAMRLKDGGVPLPPGLAKYIMGEYSASCHGTILILLAESSWRQKLTHKSKAKAMLEAFLGPWLGMDTAAALDFSAVWSTTVADLCELCLPGGRCEHMTTQVVPPAPGKHFVEQLVGLMLKLCSAALDCKAASQGLSELLGQIASAAYKVLPTISSTDPSKQHHLRGSKRSLRFDEDYRVHVMRTLPQKRQVMSGAHATRVDLEVQESRSRDWESKEVNTYLQSMWEQVGQHGHLKGPIGMVEDGSRIGNPSQETEVMAVWIPELHSGMVLPCQAFG